MHAAPFPPRARVADLTVGIGADLIALARENEALGYEVSPIRAAMARHNLRVHGFEAEIRVGDCLASSWDFEYAFADPARRSGGRRVVRAEDYQPPLPELADRMSVLALGLIKVSPMLRDEELRAYGSRVDFWSFGGECREAVLQVGRGIEDDDSIRAFHVESGSRLGGREVELLGVGHEPLEEPLEYVFEADPAAIRAHALPRLCKLLAARPLGDSSGYLTSAETAQDREGMAFSRAFRAVSYGRADLKRIREELTSRDATVEAVKIRGVREDPEVWRRGLRASGTVKLFLLLYPVGKSVRYVLAEPS